MAKKKWDPNKYLLDDDGEPFRYANGEPVPIEMFDEDPIFKEGDDVPLTAAEAVAELEEIGIDVPDDLREEAAKENKK